MLCDVSQNVIAKIEDFFELDYYDTSYNESGLLRQFRRPFHRKFEMEVRSTQVPCEPEFQFIARAYGLNGKFSESHWTPPSCIVTTPAPTTTPAPEAGFIFEHQYQDPFNTCML